MAEAKSTAYGTIYCITNKVNGKKYIGQTTRALDKRLAGHFCSKGKNGCRVLNNAISKYGKDSFVINLVVIADCQNELDNLEIETISKYGTTDRAIGYNLAIGGSGGKQSAETVARRVQKTKGQKRSEEFCKRALLFRKGKKHSDETKLKISESAKNRLPISDETREKLSEAGKKSKWTDERRLQASLRMVGVELSEESKRKIAATLTGKKQSIETIAKRVAKTAGKKRTPEVCKKISEIRKAYWAAKKAGSIAS